MTTSQQLTLTGEQHAILTLPPEQPVLIKGAAGSGKTTVAVFRAKHLLRTYANLFQPTRVALISYTNSLVNYARRLLDEHSATVATLHSIAYRIINPSCRPLKIVTDGRKMHEHITRA